MIPDPIEIEKQCFAATFNNEDSTLFLVSPSQSPDTLLAVIQESGLRGRSVILDRNQIPSLIGALDTPRLPAKRFASGPYCLHVRSSNRGEPYRSGKSLSISVDGSHASSDLFADQNLIADIVSFLGQLTPSGR